MWSNEENERLGLTVDESREMLGIGRNLMLKLVKAKGFPAVRFKSNSTIPNVKVFTEECSLELNRFTEFNKEKEKQEPDPLTKSKILSGYSIALLLT